jgi:hypothetical protein
MDITEAEFTVVEMKLIALVRKNAEFDEEMGRLEHDIDECNLLEEGKEEWQVFIRELFENHEELRKAARAQLHALDVLHGASIETSSALKDALSHQVCPAHQSLRALVWGQT